MRLQEARFPDVLTLDSFDFSGDHGVDKAKLLALARGSFIEDKQNIVFVGPVGTGKTHIATALGVEATCRRQRVVARPM
jgi:DNA replication protein DnaC